MKIVVVLSTLLGIGLAAEVCYPPCGCFDDLPPYDGRPLPMGNEDGNEVIYTLFTQSNSIAGQVVQWDENGFTMPSDFNANVPTNYLVHGWSSSPGLKRVGERMPLDIPTMRDMKDTILLYYDHNVILVDWSEGAGYINYFQSASNTRYVGACQAVMANSFQSLDLAHCVGHSLGGHVCGYQGDYDNGAMAWISGLDPAGPYFEEEPPELRLDAGDASFVDVTHTSSYGTVSLGLGNNIGHSDFYPHKGSSQPPCEGIAGSCDHSVCKAYYESSIIHAPEECDFMGFPCSSDADADAGLCNSCSGSGCSSMGWWSVDKSSIQGTFYLEVNADFPFCQN